MDTDKKDVTRDYIYREESFKIIGICFEVHKLKCGEINPISLMPQFIDKNLLVQLPLSKVGFTSINVNKANLDIIMVSR